MKNNYYKLCKKALEYYNDSYYNRTFSQYANITEEEVREFDNFIENKYGTWGASICSIYKQYINECNREYIKEKVNV